MSSRDPNRLYELLPAHIRSEDYQQGRQLQALMVLMARELNVVEGDIDKLYANWFIETCEDWAVPYIGDLIGAGNLRPFGDSKGELRAYVANTLSYRQRKGTAAILEQLTRDVSGWTVHAVEFFQRLIQNQYLNHLRPGNEGCVNIRHLGSLPAIGSAFEVNNHNVEVRSIESGRGRYNIPNIGLYVWRLESYYLGLVYPEDKDEPKAYRGGVIPRAALTDPGFFHMDPVGHDQQRFNRVVTERSIAGISMQRNVASRLQYRPLYDELEAMREVSEDGIYFTEQPVISVSLDGQILPSEKLRCCRLDDRDDGSGGIIWRRPGQQGEVMFDPVLGRLSLHADDADKDLEIASAYGFPADIGGGPYNRNASIASWPEEFSVTGDKFLQIGVTKRHQELAGDNDGDGPVVATLADAIVKWNQHAQATPEASGYIVIMDNATYDESLAADEHIVNVPAGTQLAIVAAGWPADISAANERTRVKGVIDPQDRRPHIKSDIRIRGKSHADRDPGSLIINGILIEGKIRVLSGELGRLDIVHTTLGAASVQLNPGITVESGNEGDNTQLSMSLVSVISGAVDAPSIAGAICILSTILGEDQDPDSDPMNAPDILNAPDADMTIKQSTVYGKVSGRTLHASDTIFVANVDIKRRQEGCVRFSYLPKTVRVPQRYKCEPDQILTLEAEQLKRALTSVEEEEILSRIQPLFTSSVFGKEAFSQLSLTCPVEISEGGENGLEMGAYNMRYDPYRRANIRDVLDEYLPVRLEAGIIFVT